MSAFCAVCGVLLALTLGLVSAVLPAWKSASLDPWATTTEESMKNCEIVSDYLFVEDPERDIRELCRAQKEKPLKILPKAEFLRCETRLHLDGC